MPLGRRASLGLLAGALVSASGPALAQNNPFLRIATGNVNGTYYRIGGLVADLVGGPAGARPCDRGGGCGVPGLVAVAQSSTGSVANALGIEAGEVESGFVQGDVAFGAFTGTGVFAGREPARHLRVLASLYPESMHLVARKAAGLDEVRSLRGRAVSLDAEGSGTLVDARLVLDAYGLGEDQLEAAYMPLGPSIDQMLAGRLDAFFLFAGYPVPAVSELARDGRIVLVPIAGPEAESLVQGHSFLNRDEIPAGAYPGIGPTPTISVAAQWLVSDRLGDELVYGIARALWHPSSRAVLDAGHPQGGRIRLETALSGVAIPLHPGAERFYREQGLLR